MHVPNNQVSIYSVISLVYVESINKNWYNYPSKYAASFNFPTPQMTQGQNADFRSHEQCCIQILIASNLFVITIF